MNTLSFQGFGIFLFIIFLIENEWISNPKTDNLISKGMIILVMAILGQLDAVREDGKIIILDRSGDDYEDT